MPWVRPLYRSGRAPFHGSARGRQDPAHRSVDACRRAARRRQAVAQSQGAMSEQFCTYFDHRYAAKGLAMWRSLKAHRPDAVLHVLCMDNICEAVFTGVPLMTPVEVLSVKPVGSVPALRLKT